MPTSGWSHVQAWGFQQRLIFSVRTWPSLLAHGCFHWLACQPVSQRAFGALLTHEAVTTSL